MAQLTADTPLKYNQKNPKKGGSRLRYEGYKGATTFKEFLRLGGSIPDLRNDKKFNYVAIDADLTAPTVNKLQKEIRAALQDEAADDEDAAPAAAAPIPAPEAAVIDELDPENATLVRQPAQVVCTLRDILVFAHTAITNGPHILSRSSLRWRPAPEDDEEGLTDMGLCLGRGVYVKDGRDQLLYAVLWTVATPIVSEDVVSYSYRIHALRLKVKRSKIEVVKGQVVVLDPDKIVGICELGGKRTEMVEAAMEHKNVRRDMFPGSEKVADVVARHKDACEVAYDAVGGRQEDRPRARRQSEHDQGDRGWRSAPNR